MPVKEFFPSGFDEFLYPIGTILVGSSQKFDSFSTKHKIKDHVKMIKRIEWREDEYSKISLVRLAKNLFHLHLREAKALALSIINDLRLDPKNDKTLSCPYYYIQDPTQVDSEWHYFWFPVWIVHAIEDYPHYVTTWKALESNTNTV